MRNKLLIGLGLALALLSAPHTAFPTVTNQTVSTTTLLGADTTTYTIGFDFRAASQVVVNLIDTFYSPPSNTLLVQGAGSSQYIVSGTSVILGTATTSTQYLIITRNIPLVQNVGFTAGQPFPVVPLGQQLDLLTLEMQDVNAGLSQGSGGSTNSGGASLPSGLTGNFIGWDNVTGTSTVDIPGAGASTFTSGDVLQWNGTNWGLYLLSPSGMVSSVNGSGSQVTGGAGGTGVSNSGTLTWNDNLQFSLPNDGTWVLPSNSYNLLAGTANTGDVASTYVLRDSSGNFAASTVTGNLVGNVTGNLTGNVTGNVSGNSANVTGVVAFGNGGTGQTTQQAAMNALAAGQSTGYYLRGNGTNDVMAQIVNTDLPANIARSKLSMGTANSIVIDDGSGNLSDMPGNSTYNVPLTNGTKFVSTPLNGSIIGNAYWGLDTGVANAFVVTPTVPLTAYTTGTVINFFPANQNTSQCTINVSGVGVVALTAPGGGPLSAGQVLEGQVLSAVFDGTQFQVVGGNGSGGGVPGGADTQIQFNDMSQFAGSPNFTWNYNTNALTVTGSSSITGALYVGGGGTVTGGLDVTGGILTDSLLSGGTTMTGGTSMSGGLEVDDILAGASTISGATLSGAGNISTGGTITGADFVGSFVGGTTIAGTTLSGGGTITGAGSITYNGGMSEVGGDTLTGGVLTGNSVGISSASTIAGSTLTGGGTITGAGSLTFNGGTSEVGGSTLTGALISATNLKMGGASTLTGATSITGALFVGGGSTITGANEIGGGTMSAGLLTFTDLKASGASTLTGATSITGALYSGTGSTMVGTNQIGGDTITGGILTGNSVGISSASTISGTTLSGVGQINTAGTLTGSMFTSGASTMQGGFFTSGALSVGGSSTLTGATSITGALAVGNAITTGGSTGTVGQVLTSGGPGTNASWSSSYQVSQAQFYGGDYFTGNIWVATQTSFSNFSAASGVTYTVKGNASAPATNLPAITFSSLPAGHYQVVYTGAIGGSVTANLAQVFRFYDGTNQSNQTATLVNTQSTYSSTNATISTSFDYTTPQSSVTFSLQCKAASGSCGVGYLNGDAHSIEVYYFPSSSQIAVNSATAPNFGAISVGGGGSDFTSTSGSWTTVSSSSFSTKTLYGGGLNPTTANNFGAKFASIPAGTYRADVSAPMYITSATAIGTTGVCGFRLYDGTNQIGYGQGKSDGFSATNSSYDSIAGFHGDVTYASTQTNLEIDLQTILVSGTGTCNVDPSATNSVATITLTPLNNQQPAPILVGSVTSTGAGAYHDEKIQGTCSSSASITGFMLGTAPTIANISSGCCVVTLPAGEFSATPWPNSSVNVSASSSVVVGSSCSSATSCTVCSSTGSTTAYNFNLSVGGPH